jgi:protein-S-isoprenylcysteine O-methyltransferase Ste14
MNRRSGGNDIPTNVSKFPALWKWVARAVFIAAFTFSEKKLVHEARFFTLFMSMTGYVLIGIATAGRLWRAMYESSNEAGRLIKSCPFSLRRNYAHFLDVFGITGVGLCTKSLSLAIIAAAVSAFTCAVEIMDGERRARKIFGDSRGEYAADAPEFIPKPSHSENTLCLTVIPRMFRGEIFGAFRFIWMAGLLKIASVVIELGIFRTYMSIY